jgi:dihydroorotase
MPIDYDLILRGGTVIDPAQGLHRSMDVAFRAGKVATLSPRVEGVAAEVIDVTGRLVTPGLIDLHGHFFYRAQPLFVNPDATCLPAGVTTAVDAGSAGWATFAGFREYVIRRVETRLFAFLHLATTGLMSLAAGVGELQDLRFAQEERARDCFRRFPELLGVKVRIARDATGETNSLPVLEMARRVAEAVDRRLMVHISGSPLPLPRILDRLRAGDIVTHIFHGHPNGVLGADGRVHQAVKEAVARGIVLDVAHAGVHFDTNVARVAMEQGVLPHTLSTDMVRVSDGWTFYDLLGVMSTFLALGMPIEEVVRAVTSAPARAIGQESRLGSLAPGAEGEAAVLSLEEGDFTFGDAAGHTVPARRRFVPVLTVKGGQRWRPRP